MEEIEIKKSEQFLKTAKELSEIIKQLPISNADNDKLIAAIIEHTEAGQREAYTQGMIDTLNLETVTRLIECEELEENEVANKRREIILKGVKDDDSSRT